MDQLHRNKTWKMASKTASMEDKMKVGDLITHNPTGAVGTIIESNDNSVRVLWCVDPMTKIGGMSEVISKLFIEVKKK